MVWRRTFHTHVATTVMMLYILHEKVKCRKRFRAGQTEKCGKWPWRKDCLSSPWKEAGGQGGSAQTGLGWAQLEGATEQAR